jgi:23S rRNA-/tRNA-specific pseudouridylate synthase
MEVTKVRYFPHTGRRHQLRVHSMCLGCPIVGDYTYNPQHRDAVQAENIARCVDKDDTSLAKNCPEQTGSQVSLFPVVERMMLHAQSLRCASIVTFYL